MKGRALTYEQKRDVMERILEAWAKRPHLRLGQLIDNAYARGDLFYVEDDILVEAVEDFAAREGWPSP